MELKPGYQRATVGIIPADWKVLTLAECSTKITDGEHITPQRSSSGYFLLSARNVLNGRIDLADVDFVEGDEYRRIRQRCNPEHGDVLISCSGTVGRVAIVPRGLECVMVRSAALVKPEPAILLGAYVQYFLQSAAGQNQILASLNQGAQANLFLNHIESLRIPLPPTKGEQQAIAEALSDTDALIESLDQLIAKKRHLKQGAMQELLTGRRRLPGFVDGWKEALLGDVIEKFVGGGTPSRANASYWGSEIPWVTVKDFATFSPRHAQEAISMVGLNSSASHLIPKGTLITSTRMALGKAVVYEVDVAINQDLKALFPKPILSTQYLYFWFQYRGSFIDALGSGSTVKGISLPDLKNIDFRLPSFSEQTPIATILSDMDTEIAALEAQLTKTHQLKQGMMAELLTGRTRLV